MFFLKLIKKYRKSINPPYKPDDYLNLFLTFLVIILLPFVVIKINETVIVKSLAQGGPSFTFTAAGDFSNNATRTTAVLNAMNPALTGASFSLALGDLSYGNLTPETAWCDYVKSKVGTTYPFELVPGNHEDTGAVGNYIDNFELCLPHRLGAFTGRYSREYYFDYPSASPSARFIQMSPGMAFPDDPTYTYTAGNSHYNWVSDSIDSARAVGIKWIVVSSHYNCITAGKKPCLMGEQLFNLLVDKKVDLILQGHDHTYQRSKQLALGPTCTGIVKDSYNPNCVVNGGANGIYTKGAGTVLVIAGNGGIGNYDVVATDPEFPYFAASYGVNADPMVGFVKADVTESQMSVNFVRAYGPSYSDSFSIVDSNPVTNTPVPPTSMPIPSLTPTVTPVGPTPSSSPSPTITLVPTVTPSPPLNPTPSVMAINSLADTYVSATSPNNNFGTNKSLRIDGVPVKVAYFKFNLGPLAGRTILSANLRLRISSSSKDLQTVKTVPDTTWSETLMNYTNRPLLGSVITSFPGGSSGTWKDVPITSYVDSNKGLTVSIAIDTAGGDGMDAYSKESTQNRPQIIVNYQ